LAEVEETGAASPFPGPTPPFEFKFAPLNSNLVISNPP
jgi:hypothetical protein